MELVLQEDQKELNSYRKECPRVSEEAFMYTVLTIPQAKAAQRLWHLPVSSECGHGMGVSGSRDKDSDKDREIKEIDI